MDLYMVVYVMDLYMIVYVFYKSHMFLFDGM